MCTTVKVTWKCGNTKTYYKDCRHYIEPPFAPDAKYEYIGSPKCPFYKGRKADPVKRDSECGTTFCLNCAMARLRREQLYFANIAKQSSRE